MKKRMAALMAIGVLSLSMTNSLVMAEETEDLLLLSETEQEAVALAETEQPETQTEAPETEAPQTEASQTEAPETEAPQTEASQSETQQEKNQDENNSGESNASAESQSQPSENADNGTEAAEGSDKKAGKGKDEKQDLSESSDNVMTEPESSDVTSDSEIAVSIVGFSVDPSQYPAADASENTKYIYKYLTEELGLNHAGACGVLGNIQMESAFSPLALGDSGSSYGICQWHNERFNALISYCNSAGLDYNTLNGQLANMKRELEGSFANVLNYVRSVPNTAQGAYDAGYYWCVYYESPANAEGNGALRGNLAANEYFPMDLSSGTGTNEEEASDMIMSIRSDMSAKTDDESEPAESADEEPVLEEQVVQSINTVLSIRNDMVD